jgi:hypothetical protein
MMFGAAFGLVGIFWRDIDVGLLLEGAGLTTLGLMNGVYAVILVTGTNSTITGPRGVLFAVLAVMCLLRAAQTAWESHRIRRATAARRAWRDAHTRREGPTP